MDHSRREPTIAAIATPPGSGGIGIVRLSGPDAAAILARLFRPRSPVATMVSHKLYYGWIVEPVGQEAIDEVLAVHMRAPHTYTREEVVEIHCHGSYLVLQEVLALVLAAGARLAEAGEFTKLAFLSGRLDLTRAEAVADLLQAKTRAGMRLAVAQLQGVLESKVREISAALLGMRAVVEVAIDFPDEEVEIIDAELLLTRLAEKVRAPIRELLAACRQGRIYREGVAVVIIGQPNVGKSSLLNALLREERAIVTPIPGTTRDTIEEYLDIRGLPVRIVDTAGIREAEGQVEALGIQRTREKQADADLVLLMVDGSQPIREEDRQLLASAAGQERLLVINKIDLAGAEGVARVQAAFSGVETVAISAKSGSGLAALEEAIFRLATGGAELAREPSQGCAPNRRHQIALEKALQASEQLGAGLAAGLTPDLLAIDLQEILDHLGAIVGYTTTEDVLETIFGDFCLGK